MREYASSRNFVHERAYLFARTLLVMFVTVLLVPKSCVAGPEKAGKQYVLGICFSAGAGMDSQFKTLFSDLVKALNENENTNVRLVLYSDEKVFLNDIKSGKLDFAMTSVFDSVYSILIGGRMKPMVNCSLFGRNKLKYCIYVKKDGKIKTAADLKGAKVATYDELAAYLLLKKMMHVSPKNEYNLRTIPNASSAIYALSLDDIDAAFIVDENIDYFKMTNPGPVKNITPLLCSEDIPTAPLFQSPKVPDDMVGRITKFFMNSDREESMKRYRPLMKMIKFKVVPVSEKDFDSLKKLYGEKKKDGAESDFIKWRRYQQLK